MLIAADSSSTSSTSFAEMFPLITIGSLFSVNTAGAASIPVSTGESLTAVNSMLRCNRLLSANPSFTENSSVLINGDGSSLVLL